MMEIKEEIQLIINIDIRDIPSSCSYARAEILREAKEERLFIENQC